MKRLSALFAALLVISALAACRTNKETDRISQSSVPVKSTVSDTSSDSLTAAGAASEVSSGQTESAESSEPPKPEIVHVDGIKLSAYERTLTVGDRFMPIVTMSPANASNKAEKWESSNTAVATVNNYGNITAKSAGSCVVTVTSVDNPDIKAEFKVTVNEPVKVEMTYMDGILIVNKTYPLPQNYNPGVNPEAKAALDKMFAAAKAEQNLKMWVCSGFRSYTVQKNLYNSYVRRDGAKAADRYSARPGYSEHQTGLAFDINYADYRFKNTAEAKWLAANAYKYGFILRYPEGKESITGYMYEPWHYRYVGVESAKKIFDSGLTLEEYFGITSSYSG